MPLGAVTVQTFEAANGPAVVGLEIGCTAIHFARVFSYPRAGDVVLATAQRCLVQAAFSQ